MSTTLQRIESRRTCRLITFGCKVNQYESQYLQEALQWNGYQIVEDGRADLYVVNTCAVTQEAEGKARRLIRRLLQERPPLGVLVMGCFASRDPKSISNLGPGVRVLSDKDRLPELLTEWGLVNWPAGIRHFHGHQRAFVKVQDGCLLNCTFCIIPYVRPRFISRPIPAILEEVRGLVANGYREIVLTGIHLGHYGIDLSRGRPKSEWSRLWHLLDALAKLPGEFRIRLSSLEAAEIRGELLEACRRNSRVCPHFHVCLQSGSNKILQAMRRRYRVESFIRNCELIRQAFDNPAISTDVIVGFPGETEEDFAATLEVAERVGFAWMHIFPFSPRPGTPAAQMPNQVPSHLLQRRKEQLADLDRKLRRRYLESLIGRKLEVLAEKIEEGLPGHLSGTACRGVRVVFPGKSEWLGQILPVRAVAVWGKSLVGYAELASRQEFQDTLQILRSGAATNASDQNLAKKFSLPVIAANF